MVIQLTGFITMIVVTLLYAGELGWNTVFKYWAIFLLVVLFNTFILHIPLLSSLMQLGVALALYVKARFRASLD